MRTNTFLSHAHTRAQPTAVVASSLAAAAGSTHVYGPGGVLTVPIAMIVYESSGPFGGLHNLLRVHGSAVYKVVIPSAVSVGILIAYEYLLFSGETSISQVEQDNVIKDAYAIGAFIVFFRYATCTCTDACYLILCAPNKTD